MLEEEAITLPCQIPFLPSNTLIFALLVSNPKELITPLNLIPL